METDISIFPPDNDVTYRQQEASRRMRLLFHPLPQSYFEARKLYSYKNHYRVLNVICSAAILGELTEPALRTM
jgi:hypothetical protein